MEKRDISEEPKELKELESDYAKKIKQCATRLAKSEDGIFFFRHLMNTCGFKKSCLVADRESGQLWDQSSLYNEARRVLYLEVRGLLPGDVLDMIEKNEVIPDVKKETTKSKSKK